MFRFELHPFAGLRYEASEIDQLIFALNAIPDLTGKNLQVLYYTWKSTQAQAEHQFIIFMYLGIFFENESDILTQVHAAVISAHLNLKGWARPGKSHYEQTDSIIPALSSPVNIHESVSSIVRIKQINAIAQAIHDAQVKPEKERRRNIHQGCCRFKKV